MAAIPGWGEWFRSWSGTVVVNTSSLITGGFKEANAIVTGLYGANPWVYGFSGILTVADHLVFISTALINGCPDKKYCFLIGSGMALRSLTFFIDAYIIYTGFDLLRGTEMPKDLEQSHVWAEGVSGVLGALGSACYSVLLKGSLREANSIARVEHRGRMEEHQGRMAAEHTAAVATAAAAVATAAAAVATARGDIFTFLVDGEYDFILQRIISPPWNIELYQTALSSVLVSRAERSLEACKGFCDALEEAATRHGQEEVAVLRDVFDIGRDDHYTHIYLDIWRLYLNESTIDNREERENVITVYATAHADDGADILGMLGDFRVETPIELDVQEGV